MNKSARNMPLPTGRQGFPHVPGGHLADGKVSEKAVQIALVVDEQVTAAEALGDLPMIWGGTVIVWRCTNDEARQHERSGRFDGIVYCEADEDETLRLRYTDFRRSSLLRGLDGGSV